MISRSFKLLPKLVIALAIIPPPPALAQGLFESLFRAAAENAAKGALGVPPGNTLAPAIDPAAALAAQQAAAAQANAQAAAQQQAAAAQQQAAFADPNCKRGQLINPYYVMLQANLLPDASLADNPCVSTTQIQALHTKYSKFIK